MKKAWILSWIAAGCAAQATPQQTPGAPNRVRLARVWLEPEERWLAGTILSARRAQIGTRHAATVREVRVHEGDRVEAGAVLVRLADGDLRAQQAAARATLEAAQANERRLRLLVEQGHLPPAQLEAAEAQRAQAQAQLGAAREALTYSEIRAPFAGAVVAKLVSPGDLVGPGQPLLEMAGNALEIVATATDDEARDLSPGMRAVFSAEEARGEAQITAVSPAGDPISHRGIVRALVITGTARLRPGDFVRLQLRSPSGATRLAIPRSALVERGDLTGAFVIHGGRAQLRWLAIGDQQGDSAWIRAGLAAGQSVIDAPGDLRDGDPVEVSDGR